MNSPRRRPWWRALSLVCLMAAMLAHAEGLEIGADVLARIAQQYGERALDRLKDWTTLMDRLSGATEREKVEQVNAFFNAVPYSTDEQHWNKSDYWATPIEFLASDGGDCEDYAIAKYFTLRALGVTQDAMRLAYVKSLTLNQSHVVLVYYAPPSREPMILDNLVKAVVPAARRNDLVPVYSFNGEGLWEARREGNEIRLGSGEDVLMWKELIERMQAQKKAPSGP